MRCQVAAGITPMEWMFVFVFQFVTDGNAHDGRESLSTWDTESEPDSADGRTQRPLLAATSRVVHTFSNIPPLKNCNLDVRGGRQAKTCHPQKTYVLRGASFKIGKKDGHSTETEFGARTLAGKK